MATQRDVALYNSRIMEIPLDGVPDEIRAVDELEVLFPVLYWETFDRETLTKLAEVQRGYRGRMTTSEGRSTAMPSTNGNL